MYVRDPSGALASAPGACKRLPVLRRLPLVLGLLCVPVGLLAAPCGADDSRQSAALEFVVPVDAGCLSEAAFHDLVAMRIGYDPFSVSSSRKIRIEVHAVDGGLSGTTELRDRQQRRQAGRVIRGGANDCDEILNSLALGIAFLLDPLAGVRPREEPTFVVAQPAPVSVPVSEPRPETGAQREPAELAQLQDPVDEPEVWHLAAYVAGSGSLWLAPGPTAAPVVGIGARNDHFSIWVEGRIEWMLDYAQTALGDSIDSTVSAAGPNACVTYTVGLLCAGVQFGVFRSSGHSLAKPRQQLDFFASSNVTLGIEVPFAGRGFFRVAGEARFPLTRLELLIESGNVWNAKPVALGAQAGVGMNFF